MKSSFCTALATEKKQILEVQKSEENRRAVINRYDNTKHAKEKKENMWNKKEE